MAARVTGGRRWAARAAALMVLFLAALAGSSAPVCACSCGPSNDADYTLRADLIFEGVVVDVDKPLLSGTGTAVTVRFKVESVIKGVAGDRIDLRTGSDQASCGFAFTAGHRYRVYAAGGQTTLCAGNRDLGAAPDVPLEEGWSWTLIAIGAGVVVLILLVVAARRKPRRRGGF